MKIIYRKSQHMNFVLYKMGKHNTTKISEKGHHSCRHSKQFKTRHLKILNAPVSIYRITDRITMHFHHFPCCHHISHEAKVVCHLSIFNAKLYLYDKRVVREMIHKIWDDIIGFLKDGVKLLKNSPYHCSCKNMHNSTAIRFQLNSAMSCNTVCCNSPTCKK